MTTVVARFRVADYEVFRQGYDSDIAAISEVRSYRVWRGQDDPNLVFIVETFDSRWVAAALWSQETQDSLASDGVDMSSVQIDFLDEAAHGPGGP